MRDALAIRLCLVQRRAIDDEDTIDAPENSDGRLRGSERRLRGDGNRHGGANASAYARPWIAPNPYKSSPHATPGLSRGLISSFAAFPCAHTVEQLDRGP